VVTDSAGIRLVVNQSPATVDRQTPWTVIEDLAIGSDSGGWNTTRPHRDLAVAPNGNIASPTSWTVRVSMAPVGSSVRSAAPVGPEN
jgi:hypothetical protein